MNRPAARDRRRLARPPRLPRRAEAHPECSRAAGECPHGLRELPARALGLRAARGGGRRVGHAGDTRPTATRRCRRTSPVASSRTRCSSSSACCRGSCESFGFLVGKERGYEADDFLAAAAAAWPGPGARCDLRPRCLPARLRPRVDPAAREGRLRARPHRPGRGARALRRRARAGSRLHRAARRPLRQDPGRTRGSARRRQPRC